MTLPASLPPCPQKPVPARAKNAGVGPSPYGRPFWLAYAANFLFVAAVAVMFRYADFITLLGGSMLQLGWIVGIGMFGSLAMRVALGVGIDRHGPRVVWIGSLLLFAGACFGNVLLTRTDGPAVFLLRMLYCCSIAGAFGASLTFVSRRAPIRRMAEMVGMIGTGGFLGTVLGAQLSDLLVDGCTQRWQVDRMFFAAGAMGLIAILPAWLALRSYRHCAQRVPTPSWQLLRHCHPGALLGISVVIGVGLNWPSVFLPPYVGELGIERIGLFFSVYSLSAVLTRLCTRRLSERIGLPRMILAGVAVLALSQLLFLCIRGPWLLALPGLGYGISHAVLFPAIIAAGNRLFPAANLGLGMTLMLASWDIGLLVGTPMVGAVLQYSHAVRLPPYPTLFVAMAAILGLAGVWYGWRGRGTGI